MAANPQQAAAWNAAPLTKFRTALLARLVESVDTPARGPTSAGSVGLKPDLQPI